MNTLAATYYLSILGAFCAGVCGVHAWYMRVQSKHRHTRLRDVLGMKEQSSTWYVSAPMAAILRSAQHNSRMRTPGITAVDATSGSQGNMSFAQALPSKKIQALHNDIVQAGLSLRVSIEGLRRTQRSCALGGVAVGAVVGAVFTPALALIGAAGGALGGWLMPQRALRNQARARKHALESGLSQGLEVICLGLRAGLSFDRALALYCKSFECPLATELHQSLQLWQAGIVSREQALRTLADSYDSALLSRVVDNIVRSLRFGSPLADSLEVLAVESRRAHQAQVQEAVMKAPVKMMVPVGVLILPSMLILVLGPVLLDLMQGF